MSLNRLSYLESWVRSPGVQRQGPSVADFSDSDSAYQDLPEDSLSSSFLSTYSNPLAAHRLSFNPVVGPSWGQASVEDADDDRSTIPSPTLHPREREDGRETPRQKPPKPHEWPVKETTGAFEVSRAKRIAQVCVAVIYCFLSAGIVFGFAALKPVLIDEGAFHRLCPDAGVCHAQQLRLNLMFTIAAVTTNVVALPVGTILDTYGPQVCGVIGSLCLIIGAVCLSTAYELHYDGYTPGYFFLALGGPFIFISSFHLSNTFPARSGLILAMLTGAFDGSSAVFLLFKLANAAYAQWMSLRVLFLLYLPIPLCILILQLTLMPTTSYKTPGELVQQAHAHISAEANDPDTSHNPSRVTRRQHRQQVLSQIEDLLSDTEDTSSRYTPLPLQAQAQPQNQQSHHHQQQQINQQQQPPWTTLHSHSALTQILTPWFILITLFTILQMLRINHFIATIHQQYTHLLSSPSLSTSLTQTFDLLLPLGGILAVPLTGPLLDNLPTHITLLILVLGATLIGILGCIPHSLPAAYTHITLFALYRPFYYTAVSDYAARVFGFHTFGKVYGLIICLAGVGNFAQTGLEAVTWGVFEGDPVPVNVVLTAVTFGVGAGLVGFVWYRTRVVASYCSPGGGGAAPVGVAAEMEAERRQEDGVARRDWGSRMEREREALVSTGGGRSYGGVV